MSVALHLYQQLRDAPNDDSRAKAIAEAFEQIEERYPNKEIKPRRQPDLEGFEERLTQAIHRKTRWIIGAVGTMIFLDWLLARGLAFL